MLERDSHSWQSVYLESNIHSKIFVSYIIYSQIHMHVLPYMQWKSHALNMLAVIGVDGKKLQMGDNQKFFTYWKPKLESLH